MKEGIIDLVMLGVCIVMLFAFFPLKFSGNDILFVNPGGGSQFAFSTNPITHGGAFFTQISPIPSAPSQPSGGTSSSRGSGSFGAPLQT